MHRVAIIQHGEEVEVRFKFWKKLYSEFCVGTKPFLLTPQS